VENIREENVMNHRKFSGIMRLERGCARVLVLSLSLLLFGESPSVSLISMAQGRDQRQRASSGKSQQRLTGDQRIAHVLARLSFGARPGDFERVKAMGINAYIEQQLNPETIEDIALDAKLAKLPTLALATPALLEQYNPPKPAPTPAPPSSPTPQAKALVPDGAKQNLQLASTANGSTSTVAAVTAAIIKPESPTSAAAETMKPAGVKAEKPASAKPQPPARSPQMVVTELQRAAVMRAVYSERQLNEMVVEFWENHFSIYAQKDADRFLLTGFDRDAIRPFALGRFRDLLGAVAHSPAMLFYLDNYQSSVQRQYPAANGKPARKSGGINENYARELMELHTMGVDGGYTQKDVQEVARCLTGWTILKPNQEGLFLFNPALHDNGEKVVLGHRIPPGDGITDGERVLDILASHPSTARFISTKLARRFIGDDPPAALINRATQVFLKTDGSIRETLRTIITSPEFFSRAAYRRKVRTPFEYAVAAVRALGAETNGDRPLLDWISRMGQPVFGRITPDGYPDRAEQWLSPGSIINRFNFANALATNRIKGTQLEPSRLLNDVDVNDKQAVAAYLPQLILSGDVTPATKAALNRITTGMAENITQAKKSAPDVVLTRSVIGNQRNAATETKMTTAAPAYISQLMTLIIGSPEFQRR
jgi:uncharacterized protein (DUF1800 family)